MRPFVTNRRGSALLIVLGMLAFMVVSAVAFSASMRSARLPSSYLRRTVASRLLVKAALARAIDEIDAAVGNNAHPNVGYDASRRLDANDLLRTADKRNSWVGRIFAGTNSAYAVPAESTVPTLTLEGLAYLPPGLVNEARYYSRHLRPGQWHALDYEAGRYAFTAVDVSDYFDINAVRANVARSSAPEGKISLAYLFDDNVMSPYGGAIGGDAAGWDDFVKPYLQQSSLPFVSLADWNLAAYDKFQTRYSPFGRYVKSPTGSFLTAEDARFGNMTFVTDGWFPSPTKELQADGITYTEKGSFDLTQEQPFDDQRLRNHALGYYQRVEKESSSKVYKRLLDAMPLGGMAALLDYLDYDNIPVSLAMPTTEQVPMVCAIEPMFRGQIKVEALTNMKSDGTAAGEAGDEYPNGEKPQGVPTRTVRRTVTYRLVDSAANDKFYDGISVFLKAVYPFRKGKGAMANETFTVRGKMALYFSKDGEALKSRSSSVPMGYGSKSPLKYSYNKAPYMEAGFIDGVVTIPLKTAEIKTAAFKDKTKPEDFVADVTLEFDSGAVASYQGKFQETPLMTLTYEWTQNDTSDAKDWSSWDNHDIPSPDSPKGATSVFKTVSRTGSAQTGVGPNDILNLNALVWVSVENANGNTVDLVPASVIDDSLNGVPEDMQNILAVQDSFGEGVPFMRFGTTVSVPLKPTALASQDAWGAAIVPQAVLIRDPRFNYAPENWYSAATPDWTSAASGAEEQGRDGDIFMQVSNQGELQSVYELANILRLNGDGFGRGAINANGGVMTKPTAKDDFATASGSEPAAAVMWKTYDPFGEYLTGGDGFESLGLIAGGGGFKINPYTDATNIMMAAFANTPLDWSAASVENGDAPDDVQSFNQNWTWSGNGAPVQLDADALEEVAGAFMEDMRNREPAHKGKNEELWESVWREMEWSDQKNEILDGLSVGGELYACDKKFLYGFWHDCFAARQQLFLIFVRAEPSMMGGGSGRQQPPQLGARAVALVWRDPTMTTNGNVPHKTRVLFYRQLD